MYHIINQLLSIKFVFSKIEISIPPTASISFKNSPSFEALILLFLELLLISLFLNSLALAALIALSFELVELSLNLRVLILFFVVVVCWVEVIGLLGKAWLLVFLVLGFFWIERSVLEGRLIVFELLFCNQSVLSVERLRGLFGVFLIELLHDVLEFVTFDIGHFADALHVIFAFLMIRTIRDLWFSFLDLLDGLDDIDRLWLVSLLNQVL